MYISLLLLYPITQVVGMGDKLGRMDGRMRECEGRVSMSMRINVTCVESFTPFPITSEITNNSDGPGVAVEENKWKERS